MTLYKSLILFLYILSLNLSYSLCLVYPSATSHQVKPRTQSTSNKYTPTNSWFQNWLVGSGENPIQTYPYIVRASKKGFTICYPSQIINQNAYMIETFLENLILKVSDNFPEPYIDVSTVNADFFNLGAKVNFGDKFSVQVTRGYASIIANIKSSAPVLNTIHAILTFETISDKAVKFSMNNNQVWLIQSENSLAWKRQGSEISGPIYTGWIKISIITSQIGEQNLLSYQNSIITDGKVNYKVNRVDNNVEIKLEYNSQGLYYMLPHVVNPQQTQIIAEANARGVKGNYKLSKGNGYTYKLPIYESMENSRAVDSNVKKDQLLKVLKNDVNLKIESKDPYYGGKQLARTARLIEIAHLVKDNESKEKLKNNLVAELDSYWFGVSSNSPALVYEPTWGGIVSKNSVGSSEKDFGIYYYNDHHFHYGYFINVAATLAKHYPDYYQTRKEYFNLILGDFAGVCLHNELPCRPRNKDPFLGHSYASGIFEFADSKNQESTSEAINSYWAVRELGKVTGNKALQDLGDYLLSTEIHATKIYWQIRKNSEIYSEPFSKNGLVGILWETKADYATWFGSKVEFIYGIQMVPFTEITPAYLVKEWLTETRGIWSPTISSEKIDESWKGFMLLADALVDPKREGLAKQIHSLDKFDNGNTKTNTLYFYYLVGGAPVNNSSSQSSHSFLMNFFNFLIRSFKILMRFFKN